MKRIFGSFVLLSFALLGAASAVADWGGESTAEFEFYTGDLPLTLPIGPSGTLVPFADARDMFGVVHDATIVVVVRNANYEPIVGYPAEDVFVLPADGGVVFCAGGNIADEPTDAEGVTRFSRPLAGGGHSQDLAEIWVGGQPLSTQAGMDLWFNSPDLNSDLVVDLLDLIRFTEHLYSSIYEFAADFLTDGEVNVGDLAIFAQAYGTRCP